MSGTDSSPSIMPATAAWGGSAELLETEVFPSLAHKLVRRAIASQFVDDGHPVLSEEDRLIGESVSEVRDYLASTAGKWGSSMGLAKLGIVKHVRGLAVERLQAHDLDDATRTEAMARIFATDLGPIFPDGWSDC